MSSPNYEYTFLPQVFHYGETPTDETMWQIQRSTVHTANLIRATSYFQGSVEANTEEEEAVKQGAIFQQSIQIFRQDNQVGDGTLNVLNSPPQPVQGLILVDGHATEQNVLHGVVLLNENFAPINTPSSLTTASDNKLLFITNPDILLPP